MSNVITRFAPSPTGTPHIGNIRTALFNFLFARNQKGVFILRIEDTDQKRFVPESVDNIKESLKSLNLSWDLEEVQSKRLKIYHKYLDILKEKGLVYEDEGAVRFKVSKKKELTWQDLVHGDIIFASDVIEDFVLVKSDGYPTYHFASVVDDHEMKITHVLRGDEWISSTPKHLLLYEAFGWESPKFAHMPAILGAGHKKLSKREGAKSVFEYLDEGYLPEALVNFLALLGWAPKNDKEIFSLDELVDEFSIERINKNSPIFNLEKLRWFNNQWIKKLTDDDLTTRILKFYPQYPKAEIAKLIPLVKERMFTFKEFKDLCDFIFESPQIASIPSVSVLAATIASLSIQFGKVQDWEASKIKKTIEDVAEKLKEDRIATIAAVRNIVSGKTVTPPLYESLEILGKEETVKRLDEFQKSGSRF
ncbi:hypothetical protein A3D81_00705 [Candidatus Curtissbacteria bacterium RIFCSPHIGHO2_02_FULL_40_17]|uniref:Glutamate--tRNA ligase n=3 Tax=Candidatus Curtissiibacteriota TaxID=1752717 RepID=A0A1F5GJQ5_9BACT|nr:MAG: hypothetical protein A2693_01875 [Candidatus Curtissbacteria bacterium RIFCSPHIGHO2_01_FULL_40_12]OGD92102.1 MAG: hypothetical protein A3D81_00705 [Candidatus Curtissbacteria bacterium RIFCSPHIGHO2_02_FULL_40_17]